MADKKITALTALTTLSDDDLFVVVDDPSGTPTSKKITAANVTSGLVAKSVVTTKGDLIAATASATVARLGVGTDGQALLADSSTATGLAWGSAGSAADSDQGILAAALFL